MSRPGSVRVRVSREAVEQLADEGYGLGDLIADLTKRLGIRQCEGCKRRQRSLNTVRFRRGRRA